MNLSLAFLCLSLAAGQSTSSPEPTARVPISLERDHIRVPVSVGDAAPFQLLLDTGMPTRGIMLYESERVDALGLDFADGGEISGAGGAGGSIYVREALVARIQVGSLAIQNVTVILIPRPAGFAAAGDGVIGNELFERYVLRIDREAKQLDLFETATFTPHPEDKVVPLRMRNRAPFVEARVTVAGGEPILADLALDLGARHSLWLNEGEEGRFAAPEGSIATRLGRGVMGEILGRVGRVRRFEIGGFAFDGVVAIFPGAEHQQPGGGDFRDGFVGARLLSRFIVTFDYAGERMLLRPSARFAEPFEHDMTGMVLDPDPEGRFLVSSLIPGSPAEAAGVARGDILLAVDEKPVLAGQSPWLERAFRTEGAQVRLRLMRGSETIDKSLRLRRLL